MNQTQFKKAIIIQTAFIGDVILTTPLIEVLSTSFPGIELDFLTIPKSSALVENNPKVSSTIIFDKKGSDAGIAGLWRMGRVLQKNNYELCLTPHRSMRSAILAYMTGASIRIGFDRSSLKSAFTHIITYQENRHEIERNLSLLNGLNIKTSLSAPSLYSSDDDKATIAKLLYDLNISHENRMLAIAPGSIWNTKRWPEDYFAEFCRLSISQGFKPVLIGSREDQKLCSRIAQVSNDISTIAGSTTLPQTYEFLTHCIGIVTNDSAPLHLGMAARIPVFAIFGPTVKDFGFAPFGKQAVVIEEEGLNCRPCAIHGGNKCPLKTFECMLSLKPELLMEEVLHFYKSNSMNTGINASNL
jgi:heptosyltransferase-2